MNLHFRWYLVCCWFSVISGAVLSVLLLPINLVRGLFGLRDLYYSITNLFSTEVREAKNDDLRPLTKVEYAIRYLYPDEYSYHWVLGLAQDESGGTLGSGLAKTRNNLFGYGFTKNSPFQMAGWDSKKVGEPIFAVYKNVFYSVYDFYYMSKIAVQGNRARYIAVTPDQPWEVDSPFNVGYIRALTSMFHRSGYFTANPDKKASNIYQHERKQYSKQDTTFKATNIISVLLSVGFLFISFRWVFPNLRRTNKEIEGAQAPKKRFANPFRSR